MTGTDTTAYMTEREAAAYLGVSPRQLRRWRDTGAITYRKLSERIYRYRRSDLEEFAESRAVAPVVVPMTR